MVAYVLVMAAMTMTILWVVWRLMFGHGKQTKNITVEKVEEELATLKSRRSDLSDEVVVVEEMIVEDEKIEQLEDRLDHANNKRKS